MTASEDPDPLRALAAEALRARRAPPGSACAECGIVDSLCLAPDGRVLCYQHLRVDQGRSGVELDHVAGRANLGGFLVPLEANAHRSVTDARRALGMDGWPEAGADPLLVAAHALGGIATITWLIARWLVELSGWLRQSHGPSWWEGAPPFPIRRDRGDGG